MKTLATLFFVASLLFAGFWVGTLPLASAREMTPAEILQSKLPPPKTLANATKQELLNAVCAAVRSQPAAGAQIVRAAVEARKAAAAEIVAEAIGCAKGPQNCALTGELVNAAIAASPDQAAAIVERATAAAPDCRGAIEQALHNSGGARGENIGGEAEGFGSAPVNQNPPPGTFSAGGGGFNPQADKCTVCHNGHEISIPCAQVEKYLSNHPGDTLGACQVTSTTNR